MKKKFEQNAEIVPLNKELFSEFHLQELEDRLETDPFAIGGLFIGTCAANTCFCNGDLCLCNHKE